MSIWAAVDGLVDVMWSGDGAEGIIIIIIVMGRAMGPRELSDQYPAVVDGYNSKYHIW